jgi:hypothetical protein
MCKQKKIVLFELLVDILDIFFFFFRLIIIIIYFDLLNNMNKLYVKRTKTNDDHKFSSSFKKIKYIHTCIRTALMLMKEFYYNVILKKKFFFIFNLIKCFLVHYFKWTNIRVHCNFSRYNWKFNYFCLLLLWLSSKTNIWQKLWFKLMKKWFKVDENHTLFIDC